MLLKDKNRTDIPPEPKERGNGKGKGTGKEKGDSLPTTIIEEGNGKDKQ